MAELEQYTDISGDIPWAMQQDQRGPTCGMTSIAVAYRILTGWTVFPTKGNYRAFMDELRSWPVEKGQENIYSIRKAAKDNQATTAGEIVNADDMVQLINNHAQDVHAGVVEIEPTRLGYQEEFLSKVREAIKSGLAPIILFYVDGPTDNIGRQYKWQHWVNIFAVEDGTGKWLQCNMKNLSFKQPITLNVQPKKDQILIWTWGMPFTIDGKALGAASALSIDWASKPRMWKKGNKVGKLDWDEIVPDTEKYVPLSSQSPSDKVRYTQVVPKRALELRGFVAVGND